MSRHGGCTTAIHRIMCNFAFPDRQRDRVQLRYDNILYIDEREFLQCWRWVGGWPGAYDVVIYWQWVWIDIFCDSGRCRLGKRPLLPLLCVYTLKLWYWSNFDYVSGSSATQSVSRARQETLQATSATAVEIVIVHITLVAASENYLLFERNNVYEVDDYCTKVDSWRGWMVVVEGARWGLSISCRSLKSHCGNSDYFVLSK